MSSSGTAWLASGRRRQLGEIPVYALAAARFCSENGRSTAPRTETTRFATLSSTTWVTFDRVMTERLQAKAIRIHTISVWGGDASSSSQERRLRFRTAHSAQTTTTIIATSTCRVAAFASGFLSPTPAPTTLTGMTGCRTPPDRRDIRLCRCKTSSVSAPDPAMTRHGRSSFPGSESPLASSLCARRPCGESLLEPCWRT